MHPVPQFEYHPTLKGGKQFTFLNVKMKENSKREKEAKNERGEEQWWW
jgi:hypothetical protein